MLTWRDKVAIVVFSGLLVVVLLFALCLVAFVIAFRVGMTSLLRLGSLLTVTLLLSGCAHPPPVPPAPDPFFTRFILPQTIPGDWAFCLENPHANSHFDTPVARTGIVCAMTVDELRHWFASSKALD